MSQAPDNGPDGSSLKPVSSLLARFENLNTQPPSSQASSRSISPVPKPEKLKDIKAAGEATTTVVVKGPPPKPPALKAKPTIKPKPTQNNNDTPPPIPHASRPSISAREISPPPAITPAVKIEPPHSPPKPSLPFPADNQLSSGPTSNTTLTPGRASPLTIPGRSASPAPAIPPPRSPRLGSSKPPSPPPPRRSGEMRRAGDIKQIAAPEPDKLQISAPSLKVDEESFKSAKTESSRSELSPFTSPPSSPMSEEESPPKLPVRPRPPSRSDAAVRYTQEQSTFAPPPVRHSVGSRRNDRQVNQQPITYPRSNAETRPSLPARSKTHDQIGKHVPANADRPPPRPPRPNGKQQQHLSSSPSTNRPPPATNVTSNASKQFLPPPTRTNVKTKTAESAVQAADEYVPSPVVSKGGGAPNASTLPQICNVNRNPPFIKRGCYEIQTRFDPKLLDVCGDVVCASGHLTRTWNIMDGEQEMSLAHTEGTKATSVAFKPSANPDKEGSCVWVGTSSGEILEAEVANSRIMINRPGIHGRNEVVKIYRYYNELWSLDESGNLHLWGPDSDGMPNLNKGPTQSYKMPKGHTFSIIAGDELWYATGKTLRVFNPSLDGTSTFQVFNNPIVTESAGDITSGTAVPADPDHVYFGHNDGKISVYSLQDYSCKKVINSASSKITSMAAIGSWLWVGHNTGRMCVYEVGQGPWRLAKEWQAHESSVYQIKADPASPYFLNRLQVLSVGNEGKVKIWDGSLQDDHLERGLRRNEEKYCQFSELKALVMTWNAGASTPHSLRYSDDDAGFFRDLLRSSGSPDILVFGFQELVDLEDKAATAKRFLKSKKRDGTEHERMSHQYRDWRDFLLKTLDDYMPADDLYHLLYTAPLVGLFSCVFVKSSLQHRIHNLSGSEVKRGMGGLHGNKGAIVVRFQVDDSSLCFVNCHLAAGQTHTAARHADAAAILEAPLFPVERDTTARLDGFVGGGDGSMILDHELCILNGDLNYRIDTMSRKTVEDAVKNRNLAKLLERDQLLAARRKNPVFRLRAFEELPITFDPTYKYNVGTDVYDTSEKRRTPAWCDRLLYRGQGKIQQLDYQRHEVRVSDHRPVSGCFRLRTKRVDARARAAVWADCQQKFEDERQHAVALARTHYLENVCGFDEPSAKRYIKARLTKSSA